MRQGRKNQKFIIIAQARSGSNSLMDALNKHPKISLIGEPFNETRDGWGKGFKNYKKELKNKESLKGILDRIFKRYTGFKTLVYQIPKKYSKAIFSGRDLKVILLHRKNKLKCAVSLEIAKQTEVWHVKDRTNLKTDDLHKLNIKNLKDSINFQKNSIKERKKFLEKNRIPYLEVSYEDLHETSRSKRLHKIKEIFEFLGYKIPGKEELKEIDTILSPKRKIAKKKLYMKIPNIKEVENKLGSRENGHLFDSLK